VQFASTSVTTSFTTCFSFDFIILLLADWAVFRYRCRPIRREREARERAGRRRERERKRERGRGEWEKARAGKREREREESDQKGGRGLDLVYY